MDQSVWRPVHIGFDCEAFEIDGIEIWKQKWRRVGDKILNLPHPAHLNQVHPYHIYEVGDLLEPRRFAAAELSPGVWGFYVPLE